MPMQGIASGTIAPRPAAQDLGLARRGTHPGAAFDHRGLMLSTPSKGSGSSSRSARSAIPYSYDARGDLVRHTPCRPRRPVPAPVASPARVPSASPPSPSRATEPGAARADLRGGPGRGLRPRRTAKAKRKRQAVKSNESLSATKNRRTLESSTTLNRASIPAQDLRYCASAIRVAVFRTFDLRTLPEPDPAGGGGRTSKRLEACVGRDRRSPRPRIHHRGARRRALHDLCPFDTNPVRRRRLYSRPETGASLGCTLH